MQSWPGPLSSRNPWTNWSFISNSTYYVICQIFTVFLYIIVTVAGHKWKQEATQPSFCSTLVLSFPWQQDIIFCLAKDEHKLEIHGSLALTGMHWILAVYFQIGYPRYRKQYFLIKLHGNWSNGYFLSHKYLWCVRRER